MGEATKETSYMAKEASMGGSLTPNQMGLKIEFYGYNDSIENLVKEILPFISNLERNPDLPEMFEHAKESII